MLFLLIVCKNKINALFIANLYNSICMVYCDYKHVICKCLTFNLLNFLNGIIHLPFLEQSIITFMDIKMRTQRLSANSIEHGQTAQMCMLAWLNTGGKG